MRRATLVVGVLALLVGCGGSDESPKPGGAPAAKATATPDANTIVRWPRFWAVREGAETGADDKLETRYMAGYDENAVVYNGQDVVRVLAKKDGKQIGRVLLPRGRFVCATSPRREIDAGVAVFGVGTIGRDEGTCDQVIGVSTRTGKKAWSSPKIPRAGVTISDPLVDARDGVTMFSTGRALVAFDTATGKQQWRRSAAKIAHARRAYDRERCEIAAALAADRPVIVVYPSDCASGFDPTEVVGLDLKTGKELWVTEDPRDPAVYSPFNLVPHPLDGRLLGVIADRNDDEAPDQAAFVESESGNASRYGLPASGDPGDDPLCTDFAADGLAWSDTCIFVAGSHLLHVHLVQSVPDDEDYIEIVAAELDSGVEEWRFRWDGDGTPRGHPAILGLNATRDEFWVGEGFRDIERLSVDTGKRVGIGNLAPPLNLPRFGVAGPDFLLVRGVVGILDVKSGLDYYATKAPSG